MTKKEVPEALLIFWNIQKEGLIGRIDGIERNIAHEQSIAAMLSKIGRLTNKTARQAKLEKDLSVLKIDLKNLEAKIGNGAWVPIKPSVTLDVKDAMGTLGLSDKCSLDEIKSAYRALAKQHHPDAGGDDLIMAKINKAYTKVLNAQKGVTDDKK